jgi:hypothetical protein
MVAAVVVLGLLSGALLVLLYKQETRHQEHVEQLMLGWFEERTQLITRIQRPEFVPPAQMDFKQPAPPRDAQHLANVGTVIPLRDSDEDDSA